jgi:hypothetical protein
VAFTKVDLTGRPVKEVDSSGKLVVRASCVHMGRACAHSRCVSTAATAAQDAMSEDSAQFAQIILSNVPQPGDERKTIPPNPSGAPGRPPSPRLRLLSVHQRPSPPPPC